MIQSKEELEDWYNSGEDPWGYYQNRDDAIRKARILAAIPQREYAHVLDIGAGNGFITRDLPGSRVTGLEMSEQAISWARGTSPKHVDYVAASLFDLPALDLPAMDLIVITGVLYPHYIGRSLRLTYVLIDQLLSPGGILLCSHINAWYQARFPYLTLSREYFPYREFYQVLEVYCK